MAFKAFDVDRGYEALKKRLGDVKDMRVTVGVHGDKDNRGDSETNVFIGSVHEFGWGTAPQRSFLRRTLDEHGAEYAAYARELFVQVVDGKMSNERALGLLGAKVKADVVRLFDTNQIRPDISAETKKRKGSSTVLIDTASLKQALDYVVRKLFDSAGQG